MGFLLAKKQGPRVFFKFFNNKLGINTRVSHFVDDFDRSCDLCIAWPVKKVLLIFFFIVP